MKKTFIAIFVFGLMAALVLLSFCGIPGSPEATPPPPPVTPPVPPPVEAPVATNQRAVPFSVPSGGSPLARSLNAPTNTAAQDVAILSAVVRQFLSVEKPQWRKPVGDNYDLAKALQGSNRTHVVFIPAGHPVYDGKGRLTDRWGTPYFVHPLASDRIEIRSAGPDRKLFTDDDVK